MDTDDLGRRPAPVKLAPYTRGMLDVCKNNLMSIMILATSSRKGKFSAQARDRALFGLAPLPYVTGLFPLLIDEEIAMKFLPPPQEAGKMSFSERNRRGFSLGMKRGIDLFFGLSSVISYITDNFASVVRKGSAVKLRSLFQYSPRMLVRYLRASYRSKRDGTPLRPKDLFSLKAFVCAGTDTRSYKQSLADAWGVTPMEISAGTEPTIIGTETWKKDGQVFFPDAGFYEFIEEEDMKRNLDDPSFVPKTYLMDELLEGHCYKLVVTSFKGGAFARYRVGGRVPLCVGRFPGGGAAPAQALLCGPRPERDRYCGLYAHYRKLHRRNHRNVRFGNRELDRLQRV